jgi:hypothetical protein
MNASLQSSFAMFRKWPVLLAAPMLLAKVVTFTVYTTAKSLNDRYFPMVRLPRPVQGVHLPPHVVLPQAWSVLEIQAARGAISLSSQIAGLMLECFAMVLTVLLATEMYRYGSGSLRSAMERVKKIPSLGWTLLRFTGRLIFVLMGVALGTVSVFTILLLLFRGWGAGLSPLPVPSMSSSLSWGVLIGLVLGSIAAYFLVPHFLALILKIQGKTGPYDRVQPETAKQVLHFAWLALAAMLGVGWIVGRVNLAIAGGPLLTNTPLHVIQRLAASLITSVPIIWFVIAATVVASPAGEQVRVLEPASMTF